MQIKIEKLLFSMIIIAFYFYGIQSYSQNRVTKYLEYGKYNIGYKVFHTYDYSRSYFPKYDYYGKRTNYKLGRPIQVSIWYPTLDNDISKKMKYRKYLEYTSSEIDFSKNNSKDRKKLITKIVQSTRDKNRIAFEELLNETINVYLEAKEIKNNFPVILYAPPKNTSAFDNSIICEYLASKGYLVLSTLAKGEYTELQGESVKSVHVQAEDLAFLLNFSKKISKSDKIGTIGFSRGGIANIIFAMKNKNIDATVSLDGSILSQGWLNDIEKSEYYNPKDFNSNILFITKNLRDPKLNPSTFYDSIKFSDKTFIRFDHDKHGYFSSFNLMYELLIDKKRTLLEKDNIYKFYAEMTEYVGEFLEENIKKEKVFKEHETKLFKHNFIYQKAKPRPLSPGSINQLILDKGFNYVRKIIDDILIYEPKYLKGISWRGLLRTSNILKNENKLDDAIGTLLLLNESFPNWYITHYSLGQLYLLKKNNKAAIAHFEKAIEDNPRHKKSLDELIKLNAETSDYHLNKLRDVKKYIGTYSVDKDRYRKIYIEKGKLYLFSNYWKSPLELWPYSKNIFLIESDDPRSSMQILFQFDDNNNVISLRTRGLNSGRIALPNMKK